MQARKQRRRATAIVLAFVSAAALIAGVFGPRWLQTPEGIGVTLERDEVVSAGMGLRAFEMCHEQVCVSISNTALIDLLEKRIEQIREENKTLPAQQQRALPHAPWHGFPIVGYITLVAGLIAAAGLVIAGILAMAGKRIFVPIMPTTIAVLGLAIGIITGCIFVATKPDFTVSLVVGWTFITFGAGAVLGLAAVFPLNRAIRPIDEELGEASATMSWGASRDDQP